MSAGTRCWALVPAAGSGSRMGSEVPKQYLQIDNRPVIEHTLDALYACDRIAGIVVVVADQDAHWATSAVRYTERVLIKATGGEARCHSVLNGLDRLLEQASADDWVLVHDAARPCLHLDDIDRLLDRLGDDAVGGLLGVPVADTMKQVDANERVSGTVAREGLWHALTPQMFRIGLLRSALQQALDAAMLVTDEASAMEFAGHRPRMVQGRRDNIKVTLPADLGLAAYYLAGKGRQ